MGKFAGFLKRAKRLAGIGAGILGTVNNLYKSVMTPVTSLVDLLPGGKVINTVLKAGSNKVDKWQENTKDWITKNDRATFNSMNKTAKQIGGFINKLVPWDTVGNFVADKVNSTDGNNSSTLGNVSSTIGNVASSIFGEPLN